MGKRVNVMRVLFSIILIVGLFSLTDAYGTVSPKISAGYYYTVALKTDGSLWAWEYNDDGQLGDGTTADKHTPTLPFFVLLWGSHQKFLGGVALYGCKKDRHQALHYK